MHTGHLRKHIVADDGLIWRNNYAAVTLYKARNIVQLILADVGAGIELVLQNHLNTRQRCITTSLAKSVHCYMQTFGSAQHCSQRVRHCQIVVVVSVEVEVCIGIALQHLTEVLDALQRIHDTQRVGQHKAANTDVAESIHQRIDIRWRLLHAVAPVFEIQIYSDAL